MESARKDREIGPIGRAGFLSALLLIPAASSGCGSTKLSHTTRTATEQLLLTNAWDSALAQVDFSPMAGVPIYLETSQIESLDKGWVISSIREAMLRHGACLKTKPEEAVWVCEARVGTYGVNSSDWLIGVPQMTIPAVVPGIPGGNIPELPLMKKSKQQGVAKLALFAYDRNSGAITWTSGTALASSDSKLLNVGPVGPIKHGSIYQGSQLDEVHLPGSNRPLPPTMLRGDGEFVVPAPRPGPPIPIIPPSTIPGPAPAAPSKEAPAVAKGKDAAAAPTKPESGTKAPELGVVPASGGAAATPAPAPALTPPKGSAPPSP